MKINLWVWYHEDVSQILASDNSIAEKFDVAKSGFCVDSESKEFDRMLALTKHSSGIRLTPECVFSKDEQSQARYFQVICRKALSPDAIDDEVNLEHIRSLPLVRAGADWGIKRMERICITKAAVHPLSVMAVDWAEEYVVGRVVAELIKKFELTGFELRPVYHTRTQSPHPDVCQLYAKSLMPPVLMGPSIQKIETMFPEESSISALGALCYNFDHRTALPDFNRTAEPFSSNHLPFWVVSRRVVDLFDKNKVRGWAFRPVLEEGTSHYHKHQEKWEELREKVSSNQRHRFAV